MNHLLSIYRAESSKNTFLLCDFLHETDVKQIDLTALHALLLEEKRDDILILLGGKKENSHLSLQFLIYGCDGQFAEFCGNGAVTTAAYLYTQYPQYCAFTLNGPKGSYPLKSFGQGEYAAELPFPSKAWNPQFISNWERFQKKYPDLTYIEALEPHLTIQKEMSNQELLSLGQELNAQKDLFPLGINVNAWQKVKDQMLFVKTYERGVQRLTLACGTGSIASSAHAGLKGNILVQTPGGLLQINWTTQGVELKGKSKIEFPD